MDSRRSFLVTPTESSIEDIVTLPYVHDGKHLELFYNLIYNEMGISLPDHLRPVVAAMGDKNIRYLMVIISPGSGKSYLTGIAYPLWELGMDPNLTIMGISSGADLMVSWLQSSMNIIENNKIYHELFPHIVPDKNQGWSTTRGAFIKRTVTGEPSPSYLATGIGSKSITGQHAKLILMDDIHDSENSANSDQIAKVEEFFYKTIIGRQHPMGSRMIMIGRRWASDDLYGRLRSSGDWLVMTLANFRETAELYYDVRIPAGLPCIFNQFTPSDKVEDIKVVYGENSKQVGFFWPDMVGKYEEAILNKKNKPDIFETVYQSNPEEAGTHIFRESDFQDYDIPDSMYLGRNYDEVADFIFNMHFEMIVQSWDTAYTANSSNDPSVALTIGLRGCVTNHRSMQPDPDPVPYHYDMYILDENYQHLEYGALEQEAVDYFNIWQPNYVIVENSVAGIPLIQRLTSYSIPIVPVKVQHTSKTQRATNGSKAGSAQGWARQGRVFIPRNAMWAKPLIDELKDFTGARHKHDDRVDAFINAANWTIDLGVQSRDLPPGWKEDADIDAKLLNWKKADAPFASLNQLYSNVANPYFGMCATCTSFKKATSTCLRHHIKVPRIGTCGYYNPDKDTEATISVTYGSK
jgi:predicted phage terminase large subunit-like protein